MLQILLSFGALYTFIPIIIIVILIAAAAGLSRGWDVFTLFGFAALVGLARGAGRGHAGRGLASGRYEAGSSRAARWRAKVPTGLKAPAQAASAYAGTSIRNAVIKKLNANKAADKTAAATAAGSAVGANAGKGWVASWKKTLNDERDRVARVNTANASKGAPLQTPEANKSKTHVAGWKSWYGRQFKMKKFLSPTYYKEESIKNYEKSIKNIEKGDIKKVEISKFVRTEDWRNRIGGWSTPKTNAKKMDEIEKKTKAGQELTKKEQTLKEKKDEEERWIAEWKKELDEKKAKKAQKA